MRRGDPAGRPARSASEQQSRSTSSATPTGLDREILTAIIHTGKDAMNDDASAFPRPLRPPHERRVAGADRDVHPSARRPEGQRRLHRPGGWRPAPHSWGNFSPESGGAFRPVPRRRFVWCGRIAAEASLQSSTSTVQVRLVFVRVDVRRSRHRIEHRLGNMLRQGEPGAGDRQARRAGMRRTRRDPRRRCHRCAAHPRRSPLEPGRSERPWKKRERRGRHRAPGARCHAHESTPGPTTRAVRAERTIRRLSMSDTVRCRASEMRRPAA